MADVVDPTTSEGDGWTVSSLDVLGSGPGFRKVREKLGVTEFGISAIVVPPGATANAHWHDRQQELYFVHSGTIDVRLGEETMRLGPGGMARVDGRVVRQVSNPGDVEATFVIVGAHGGYVGPDHHMVEDTDPAHDGQHGRGGADPAAGDAQL